MLSDYYSEADVAYCETRHWANCFDQAILVSKGHLPSAGSATLRRTMRKTAWLRLLVAAAVVALVPPANVLAAEAIKGPAPRLSAQQVSTLAAAAFARSGESLSHYKAGKPQFSAATRIWWMFYIQTTPPYVVDGDRTVVVNDCTGRACVQQAMAPPGRCI